MSSAETQPLPRGERRKRRTRQRLLDAALALMGERGRDAVAIQEITEAADVGFGSFYNHFASKEAIHAALVDELLSRFAEALSHIAEKVDDPAEVLSASIRYGARRARKDPRWGRFLLRNAFSADNVSRGMGAYLLRDLQRGAAAGRFRMDDPLMTVVAVGATSVGAIAVELELAPRGGAEPEAVAGLGLGSFEEIPERAAAAALRIVGLPDAEADEIARRPLPEIELPEGVL